MYKIVFNVSGGEKKPEFVAGRTRETPLRGREIENRDFRTLTLTLGLGAPLGVRVKETSENPCFSAYFDSERFKSSLRVSGNHRGTLWGGF